MIHKILLSFRESIECVAFLWLLCKFLEDLGE